jgi:hypothetical protein
MILGMDNVDVMVIEINYIAVHSISNAKQPWSKLRVLSCADVVCEGQLLKAVPQAARLEAGGRLLCSGAVGDDRKALSEIPAQQQALASERHILSAH